MQEPSFFSDRQSIQPLNPSINQRLQLREIECNRCAQNGKCNYKQSLLDYERLKSISIECWAFHTVTTKYPFGLHMFRPIPTNEVILISPKANYELTNPKALTNGLFLTDTPVVDGKRPQMMSNVINSFQHVFNHQLDVIEGTMANRSAYRESPRYHPILN